jgi:ABC-type bacteriocin/lantibiotic exporter with double-glycine peptidase domain
MAFRGEQLSPDEVRQRCGNTDRGLTLRQLRDSFRKLAVPADAVAFSASSPDQYPCPGIVLQSEGHYVALLKKSKDGFSAFDPKQGHLNLSFERLKRRSTGLGIQVHAQHKAMQWVQHINAEVKGFVTQAKRVAALLRSRNARETVGYTALGQATILAVR